MVHNKLYFQVCNQVFHAQLSFWLYYVYQDILYHGLSLPYRVYNVYVSKQLAASHIINAKYYCVFM